jgi:protoporphyrinogen oxidase
MIVIVGAGIAGLSVADALIRAGTPGKTITIYEKEKLIGGRIHTAADGYEIGAGRIHSSHRRIIALVKRFGLELRSIGPASASASAAWISNADSAPEPNHFSSVWKTLLTQIRRLTPITLATHTLRDLTEQIIGKEAAANLFIRFPYRTEIDTMRADLAIQMFDRSLGTSGSYYIIAGGFSGVIHGLADELKAAGVRIRLGEKVTDVRSIEQGGLTVHLHGSEPVSADKVILAVTPNTLKRLPVLRDCECLKHLSSSPLLRIYAKYPSAWFADIKRTVTDNPLRYVIPINSAKGIIMISYTDGRDVDHWTSSSPPSLKTAIQTEVRRLFPEHEIPDPEWVRPYLWDEGGSVWLPGDYDLADVRRRLMQPRPSTMPSLFLCGEALSLQQAWVEGALENVEELVNHRDF